MGLAPAGKSTDAGTGHTESILNPVSENVLAVESSPPAMD
jgi:hypothetical protein